ncbi:MAG: alpha/beta hydrolase [Ruminococcaceae bacterium]|nr:alpha/beta hydrolase [Oscillospiraceae bacterium]
MREFIKEQEFQTQINDTVMPYLAQRTEVLSVIARDGGALYAVKYTADHPRGTVVLVHGFSENADKYREFIYYLLREGLSVLVYDQRGHGRSAREVGADIIHIDRFCHYVEDLEAVLAAPCAKLTPPLYLFAHSMGGAIAMLFLEKHRDVFQKAILSAPMISLQYRGITRVGAMALCRACTLLGRGKRPIFLAKRDYENESFDSSSSLSPARFSYLHTSRNSHPLLRGGSPSYQWSHAALGVTKQILNKKALSGVTLPILVYAAEHEHLVCPEAQKRLAAALPNCTLKTVWGSKHEILFANDEILYPVLEEMLDFFK